MDYVQFTEEVLQDILFKYKKMCINKRKDKRFMNILEIIEKKREKQELTKEEIKYFVKGYVDGEIADYQAAALVMAIY